jgi:hypothetical protein
MIRDPETQSEIAQQWAALRKLCAGSHRQSQIAGGPFINETPPDSFYNLPFLLAFAVLDEALGELIVQGTIQCRKRRPLLGDKMAASVNVLSWRDYALVDTGKAARNELAHEARLLAKVDCFRFIDAIENELRAWSIL